ncbi:hypothetical protein Cgig2_000160 [Carnegiea gigantea]|uniref:Uncharacterized protein n=1 Tax=Carnegiea gigantea TaxID=171969 RepID=A0A9Q1JRT5_9CARY|nr:hypothetical protein Cgig2_000160 [Carnegiea gigantea]
MDLRLASCNLGVLPEFLRTQAHLKCLDLSNNHIQGTVPKWTCAIGDGSLEFLNLSGNNFVDLERPIPYAPFLEALDLYSNNVQGEIPPQMEELRYLDLSSNGFTSINADIGDNLTSNSANFLEQHTWKKSLSLCNATYLEILDLDDNHFKGNIPDFLIAMTQHLGVLNARGSNLSGVIPYRLGKACVLETLDFNGNLLQGQIPRSVANCKEYKVLDLGKNQFNDTFPCELKSDKIILDLAFNHFNSEIIARLILNLTLMMARMNKSLTKPDDLHYGSIKEDYYQDELTVTFKGNDFVMEKILTIITSVNLSNNDFHGEITKELGKLNALTVLNLSHNSPLANIPSLLGHLSHLESLDLSCNALNGKIPRELAKLRTISTSTQLQSFNTSSYKGKLGLYDPPLTPKSRNRHALELTPPAYQEELH